MVRHEMVRVRLNGEERAIEDGTTVAALVESLGIVAGRVAVERNRRIVARAEFATTTLAEGDALEIVHLVGGG